MFNSLKSTIFKLHPQLDLYVTHLFVANAWSLGEVPGSGCLGNPSYFPRQMFQSEKKNRT